MLAETYDRIALIVLEVTTDAAGAIAFRELQLDAPRVATIPTMVIRLAIGH